VSVRVVENAIVVPPDYGQTRPRSGVFDADGAFVDLSETVLSHGNPPIRPKVAAPEAELRGTHPYARLARAHFGHFLMESATRLPALGPPQAHSALSPPSPAPPRDRPRPPHGPRHRPPAG